MGDQYKTPHAIALEAIVQQVTPLLDRLAAMVDQVDIMERMLAETRTNMNTDLLELGVRVGDLKTVVTKAAIVPHTVWPKKLILLPALISAATSSIVVSCALLVFTPSSDNAKIGLAISNNWAKFDDETRRKINEAMKAK
jgi:hypothetical protein